jgi:IclR family pca regulon transcriptional regulator
VKEESRYVIESLHRGLQVLSLFTRERPALTLTEIVEATGFNKTTVFRIVTTLNGEGYLERDKDTRRYRPGLKVLRLGFTAISSLELRQAARPHLSRLAEITGETASLGVLDGLNVVYIERIRGRQIIVGVVLGIGSRIPAHCASMGKVLMAHLPDSELSRLLHSTVLEPCTPESIVNKAELRTELELVRKQGYATNNEELETGLRAVSLPIWDHSDQVVAAINVSGSVRTISCDRLLNDLMPKVRDTSVLISQALGYSDSGNAG